MLRTSHQQRGSVTVSTVGCGPASPGSNPGPLTKEVSPLGGLFHTLGERVSGWFPQSLP